MLKFLKTKLERIRRSDDSVKKRWVFGASAASMILIIALWLLSLNNLIAPAVNSKAPIEEPGFWQIMKSGLAEAANSIKKQLNDLISKLEEERSITIEK